MSIALIHTQIQNFLKSPSPEEIAIKGYWGMGKTFSGNAWLQFIRDKLKSAAPFLLQSGVVPPPKTAFQDIYILGNGEKVKVSTVNGKIDIQFRHEFPFLNAKRLQADEMQPDEDLILQMRAEATISRINESKPSFLFHSAGKDSNSIALALAEAGWQDKVTLITHKSKGQADESEISAKIAKQLGFKHQILHEVDQLQAEHKQAINDYFVNAPFPCTDNCVNGGVRLGHGAFGVLGSVLISYMPLMGFISSVVLARLSLAMCGLYFYYIFSVGKRHV